MDRCPGFRLGCIRRAWSSPAAAPSPRTAPPDAKCHLIPPAWKGYRRIVSSSVRVRLHIWQHKPVGIRWPGFGPWHDARRTQCVTSGFRSASASTSAVATSPRVHAVHRAAPAFLLPRGGGPSLRWE
jgi:hypothetical protein